MVRVTASVIIDAHGEFTGVDGCRAGWVFLIADWGIVVIDFAVHERNVAHGSVVEIASDGMMIKIERNLLFVADNFFSVDEKGNDIVGDCFVVGGHDGWVKFLCTLDAGDREEPFGTEGGIFGDDFTVACERFGAVYGPAFKSVIVTLSL